MQPRVFCHAVGEDRGQMRHRQPGLYLAVAQWMEQRCKTIKPGQRIVGRRVISPDSQQQHDQQTGTHNNGPPVYPPSQGHNDDQTQANQGSPARSGQRQHQEQGHGEPLEASIGQEIDDAHHQEAGRQIGVVAQPSRHRLPHDYAVPGQVPVCERGIRDQGAMDEPHRDQPYERDRDGGGQEHDGRGHP